LPSIFSTFNPKLLKSAVWVRADSTVQLCWAFEDFQATYWISRSPLCPCQCGYIVNLLRTSERSRLSWRGEVRL
jgi:hypothetical protein